MPTRPVVACALCVGASTEPYFEAMLRSIAPAVDLLVVNDNAPEPHSDNVAVLERSAFAERGALRIYRHPFVDYADMRNQAFAPLRDLPEPPDWVLFIDADEVHGEQVRYIARELLPALAPRFGSVDAYTFHFFGTFGWISDVARRFCFYRFTREIAWVNPLHEKITGLTGTPLVLPYVFHHYGNVRPAPLMAAKQQRYYAMGNPVPRPLDPGEAWPEVFLSEATSVRPFNGGHPAAARSTLAALARRYAAEFAELDAGFRARRTPAVCAAAAIRGFNETLRFQLRRVEHPMLYRESTFAR